MVSVEKRVGELRGITDNSQPLFFMLGPCAIESEKHLMMMAEQLVRLSQELNFRLIFKSSFDKANRTSLQSYRSVGMQEGLRFLRKVKETFEVPIVTDVHESNQIPEVSDVADVIQIPAFLCRQTDLLFAAGKSGKIVFPKKGQFVSPEMMAGAVEKIREGGSSVVWLGERGTSFGYNNLVVDYRSFPIMKSLGVPVVYDATHAVQRPGGLGKSSGGDREFVAKLATSAVAQGIAGIFMETHEEPERALCDGPNSIRLSHLPDVIKYLMELDSFVKSKPFPECW